MNARLHPPPHRLIRQITSGLYLAADGQWVAQEEEAFDFPDFRSALATCEQMQESGVEMVVIFSRENAEGHRA
jgi:hypothetical protein